MSPYLPLFITFLLTNFRKFSKFGVLCPAIFFQKFPKISRKVPEIFSTFSKSKKNYHFCTHNSQKLLFKSKFDQIFPYTPRNTRFVLKNSEFFKIFGAFGPENLDFYVPEVRSFMSARVPLLGGGFPPKYTLIHINGIFNQTTFVGGIVASLAIGNKVCTFWI